MESPPGRSEIWATSHWSLVRLSAARSDPDQRRRALEQLFESYRVPIERTLAHHLRGRRGLESDAADLFAHCIAHDVFAKADPSKGRFRQFMQGVVRTYVLELAKRGARRRHLDVDEVDAPDPRDARDEDPEGVEQDEERAWALGILEGALGRLAAIRPDDAALVRAHYLSRTRSATAELAAERGVSLETLQRQLSRARARLEPLLLEEIAHGIASPEDFERERKWLETRLLQACPGLYGE